MLKILIKKQLYELNRSFFYDQKKGKARSKAASIGFILLYALLMVGFIGGMFAALSYAMCGSFVAMELDWLYFALMSIMALFMGVFGSVFNTYSSLYKAKDNDLLLSLPVPTRHILISRLMGVYLMGLMFSAVVILPAVIVYFIVAKPGIAGIFGSLVLIVLISLVVFILSCLLGWLVAKISTRLKNKSLVVVVLSLAFLGGYYYVCMNAYELITALIYNAVSIGVTIKGAAYPIYLIGRCGQGDMLALLIVTAAVLALSALTYMILARSFIKIVTSSDRVAKKHYREDALKSRSVSSALLGKEAARLTSSPVYMLNCALGMPILLIAGAALLIKGSELTASIVQIFPISTAMTVCVLTLAVCFLSTMNDLTAPSISLEGKSVWVAQSLPVAPRQVLRAKLRLHFILTALPQLFCSLCICIVFRPAVPEAVMCFVLPPAFTLLMGALGLMINLLRPNLNWQNETIVVKQSIGVMIVLFGGWLVAAVLGVGCYLLRDAVSPLVFMLLAFALLAALSALVIRWVYTKGSRIFANL